MATDFSQSTRDPTIVGIQIRRADGWNGRHELRDGETVTVGSKESCGVHLPGQTVASIHCVLRLAKGELWVQDWYSSGGTCVNGERIAEATCVPPGADIRVGDYTLATGNQQPSDSACGDRPDCQDTPPVQHDTHRDGMRQDDTKQEDAEQKDPAPIRVAEDLEVSLDTAAGGGSVHDDGAVTIDRELSEDRALLRQSALDCLDLDDDALDDATQMDFADEFEQETVDLLRAEVEQLQCELAEREQELEDLRAQNECSGDSIDLVESPEPSAAFVDRMEELLAELERSDDRMAQLEELLRCSEEATRAEHDERQQLEAWFGDIERRVSQREAEWKAEQEVLQQRLTEIKQKGRRLEEQLQQNLPADNVSDVHQREMQRLREENEQLSQKLEKAEQHSRQLAAQHQRDTNEGFAERVQAEVDSRLREEHVRMAQDRAVMARQQAELVSMRSELERLSQPGPQGCDVDARVRVFREHLREIHGQEERDLDNRSLTKRVADLWRRLDGRG